MMNYEVSVHDYENELVVSAQFKNIRDAFDFFKTQGGKEVSLFSAITGELYVQRYRGEIVHNIFTLD